MNKIDSPLSFNNFLAEIKNLLVSNKSNPEQAMQELSQKLKVFSTNGFKKAILQILGDPILLNQIAKRSYLHGNGFYKIILDDNSLFRLRLHIWKPECKAEENIHDHRWHFASSILTGKMETEIWEDATPGGGNSYDEYLYIGKTEKSDASVQYIGKSEVCLKEKLYHSKGDSYYMLSHQMHRIIYGGDSEISTLMCHTKDTRRWARTITKNKNIPDVDHNYLDDDELVKILSDYVSTL